MGRLSDKFAIVTGGARGIGRAITIALAREGANVAVLCRHPEAGQEVRAAVASLGCRTMIVQADVADESAVQSAVTAALTAFGRVDILVNNAGIHEHAFVVDMSLDDWHRTITTNLTGVFLCARAVAPIMIAQCSGRIVNIASMAAKRGAIAGYAHYGASKSGVLGFTKTLAMELAPHGITVNAIAPGLIAGTEMGEAIRTSRSVDPVSLVPLGRLGQPEDVAAAVVFLASSEAAFITGETIMLSGGAYME